MTLLANPRQERFCLEYVATGNALQSALKVGYSEKSVTCTSSRLLDNARISARIAELRAPLENPPNAKIMSEKERRERLSEVGRAEYKAPVMARDVVVAIDKLNLMDKVYEPGSGVRDINVVFVLGKGYIDRPRLVEGKVEEPTSGSSDKA